MNKVIAQLEAVIRNSPELSIDDIKAIQAFQNELASRES